MIAGVTQASCCKGVLKVLLFITLLVLAIVFRTEIFDFFNGLFSEKDKAGTKPGL